jgi:hypothetical protein
MSARKARALKFIDLSHRFGPLRPERACPRKTRFFRPYVVGPKGGLARQRGGTWVDPAMPDDPEPRDVKFVPDDADGDVKSVPAPSVLPAAEAPEVKFVPAAPCS